MKDRCVDYTLYEDEDVEVYLEDEEYFEYEEELKELGIE